MGRTSWTVVVKNTVKPVNCNVLLVTEKNKQNKDLNTEQENEIHWNVLYYFNNNFNRDLKGPLFLINNI